MFCEYCDKMMYAKKLCRHHYNQLHKTGYPLGIRSTWPTCAYPNCNKKTMNEFCTSHRTKAMARIKLGLPVDYPQLPGGFRGNNKSEYHNHYLMKKNRLLILKQYNYKCNICGGKATEIHHNDRTKYIHNLSNLLPVCHKCHMSVFHNSRITPRTTKLTHVYGKNIREISEILEITYQRAYSYHLQNRLRLIMENSPKITLANKKILM